MTIEELIKELKKFPPSMEVRIGWYGVYAVKSGGYLIGDTKREVAFILEKHCGEKITIRKGDKARIYLDNVESKC